MGQPLIPGSTTDVLELGTLALLPGDDLAAAAEDFDRSGVEVGAEIIVIKGKSYRLKDSACTPDTDPV